jgi:hypothetical protein
MIEGSMIEGGTIEGGDKGRSAYKHMNSSLLRTLVGSGMQPVSNVALGAKYRIERDWSVEHFPPCVLLISVFVVHSIYVA